MMAQLIDFLEQQIIKLDGFPFSDLDKRPDGLNYRLDVFLF